MYGNLGIKKPIDSRIENQSGYVNFYSYLFSSLHFISFFETILLPSQKDNGFVSVNSKSVFISLLFVNVLDFSF